jgi:hypothetical protein
MIVPYSSTTSRGEGRTETMVLENNGKLPKTTRYLQHRILRSAGKNERYCNRASSRTPGEDQRMLAWKWRLQMSGQVLRITVCCAGAHCEVSINMSRSVTHSAAPFNQGCRLPSPNARLPVVRQVDDLTVLVRKKKHAMQTVNVHRSKGHHKRDVINRPVPSGDRSISA